MGLTWYFHVVYGTLLVLIKSGTCLPPSYYNNETIPCPDYGEIEFGTIKPLDMGNLPMYAIHIECNHGYELFGRHKIICNDRKWESTPRPRCVAQCDPPPNVENARVSFDRERDGSGKFKKGTLATYVCNYNYKLLPPENKLRVCEEGVWIGASPTCVHVQQLNGCKQPRDIENGYYVQEKNGLIDGFGIGQRLHYSCNSGYSLDGSPVQLCIEDGTWSPKIPPSCSPDITDPEIDINDEFQLCPDLPYVKYAMVVAVRGQRNDAGTISGTEVEYRCIPDYRNSYKPICEPTLLTCSGGIWLGDLPNCEPIKDCLPPPNISNGRMLGVPDQTNSRITRFPIGTEVVYQCLPGYELSGTYHLTCSSGGCWEPVARHPSCHPDEQLLDEYMNTSGTLLVSVATASGVMLILLAVCLVIVCRRRKPWGRQPLAQAVGASVPHHPTVSSGDSTSALIHDPDRLALIAFADGLQQSGLPSYEEAVRERTTTTSNTGSSVGLLGYRPHRPHWTALSSTRRNRPGASQQAGDAHVTRQSSCTSHSASMRSGSAGDPMGSTDTMTPSEVSTNVTLDTVSSHSGSQPASCRAICGSLASFDTSSVHNTEGVPLLEENEQDETPSAETGSIGVDHRSIADNASFKYRRASPDLA